MHNTEIAKWVSNRLAGRGEKLIPLCIKVAAQVCYIMEQSRLQRGISWSTPTNDGSSLKVGAAQAKLVTVVE